MEIQKLLKINFPDISDQRLLEEIDEHGKLVTIESGTELIDLGEYARFIPLVITGGIKILREDEQGNELFMYYLFPGQTCAVSFKCCMVNKPSEIRAIAEDDTTLISIPVEYMEKWMANYSSWRRFVINMYSTRFQKLVDSIDGIAFSRLDERLIKYLQKRSKITLSDTIITTHQEVAYDLNTSREVVSRLLKKLENLGRISSGRNRITLLDKA